MPYEKTSSKLEGFIAEALSNKEIQDGADQAELEEEFLASSLREKSPEIWEAAAREIEAYDQLENVRETKLAELRAAETTVGHDPSSSTVVWVLGTSVVVLSVLTLLSGLLNIPVAILTFVILDFMAVTWFILEFIALRSSLKRGNNGSN
jgi:hypothetical protein